LLGCWETSALTISSVNISASIDTSTPSRCTEACNHNAGVGVCPEVGTTACGDGRNYMHQPLAVIDPTGECSCSYILPNPNERLPDDSCQSPGTSAMYYKPTGAYNC
jgi:hypothetical protein